MTAYLGLHHGLLQGGILAALALVVIVIGLVTGKYWVDRPAKQHILRGDEEETAGTPDKETDPQTRRPRRRS